LSSRVPQLNFAFLSIHLNRFDFKIYTYRRGVGI